MHTVTVPVIYVRGRSTSEETVEIRATDAVAIAPKKSRELTLRRAITSLSGIQKHVMSDLYRHLVIGNYTRFDGEGGYAVESALSQSYPDHHTLPDFDLKTGVTHNAGGAILLNLLKHQDDDRQEYAVLAGILLGLLQAGTLDIPQINSRS